jgi:ribose transport system ATP-binding protein
MSILRTEHIIKDYPGTRALDDVSVTFDSGRVHAVVGKNGSGKSTLVKIFAGAEHQTSGDFFLSDSAQADSESPLRFRDPTSAMKRGIATVYQELSLVQGMTVAENILLGRLPMKGKFVDWKAVYKTAASLLNELHINIDPRTNIYELATWQCQMLEIAKAMSTNPKVLLLDEPTSSLATAEVEQLFTLIRQLKKKDVIIIYISHKLHELPEIADTVTVFRDGKHIGTVEMDATSNDDILHMMFGGVEIKERPKDLRVEDEVVLSVKNLSMGNKFHDVSFDLHKGEVLGIAGMLGAGRTELLRAIFGADKADSGTVTFLGALAEKRNPASMRNRGLAMTPEDRKRQGINMVASIANNLCYAGLPLLGKGAFVQRAVEKEFVSRQISELEIKVSSPEAPITSLSGGNQQKVVVGNWLNAKPRVMFFDEPSRGIDVNAKQQIFQIIWEESRKGVSSVMVSSELEELLEVCHRILIMKDGKIRGSVQPEDITIEKLYSLCMGE